MDEPITFCHVATFSRETETVGERATRTMCKPPLDRQQTLDTKHRPPSVLFTSSPFAFPNSCVVLMSLSSNDHDHEVDLPEEDTTALIAAAAAAAAVEAVDVDVHAAVLAVEEAAHKVVVEASNDDLDVDGLLLEPSQKRHKPTDHLGSKANVMSHEEALAARRMKDRNRYSQMTEEQRAAYNEKRREQYHRQNEIQRIKRRERERGRYHALDGESARGRNARRAKLERERYQRMNPQELEERNRLRRERAAAKRAEREANKNRSKDDDDNLDGASTSLPEVDDEEMPSEMNVYVELVEDV
ncbi:hypothetical protein MPSEU_000240500 [Mayamaea pseudoterrestris]|nr:hypothetical protein MPSEU_000240500 [Mayamaea pseudoterrestris]